jgi:hypothetical protein
MPERTGRTEHITQGNPVGSIAEVAFALPVIRFDLGGPTNHCYWFNNLSLNNNTCDYANKIMLVFAAGF